MVYSGKLCKLEIKIAADVSNVLDSTKQIVDFFEKKVELSEDMIFDIRVIVNELISNAILHGSKKDASKIINITAGLSKNLSQLFLIVEDQGDGIDCSITKLNFKEIINNSDELVDLGQQTLENLKDGGRGLQIISALSDCIKVNKKGNKVIVLKEVG